MNTSEKTDMIAAALSGVHKDLKTPRKDSKVKVETKAGKSYSYEYLSLPALIEHIKKALDAHGVMQFQEVKGGAGFVEVTTILMHLAGQYIELGPIFLPAQGDIQAYKAAVTSARRYALAAALGLAADEDDDAAPRSKWQSSSSHPLPEKAAGLGETTERPGTAVARPATAAGSPDTSGLPPDRGTAPADEPFGEGGTTAGAAPHYLNKDDQALLKVEYGTGAKALLAYKRRFGERINNLSDITYEMRDQMIAGDGVSV